MTYFYKTPDLVWSPYQDIYISDEQHLTNNKTTIVQLRPGQAKLKLKLGPKRNSKFGLRHIYRLRHHHKLLGQFQGMLDHARKCYAMLGHAIP